MKAHLNCTQQPADPLVLTASVAVAAGAAARQAGAARQGCAACSPAYAVHRETGSFCDQAARPQPSSCACAAQSVHNCLAQGHAQTEGYGDSDQHEKQAAARKLASETK